MPTRTITDKSIAALKVAKRKTIPDTKVAGLYVRVTPNGAKTFVAVARDLRGKQVWHTIGACDAIKLDEARQIALRTLTAIKRGRDAAGPQSYESVAESWLQRHVDARGLITHKDIRRTLRNHILPAWGAREFTSIKRSDVARLLDSVEDSAGPVAADAALCIARSVSNWFATRNDDYIAPFTKGMRRSNPKERARERTLSDDELRAIWKQAEANGIFGAFVRMLLLTGQRRTKVASMRWEDISEDGVWSIPGEKRQKGTAGELKLPQAALDIINAQSRMGSNPHVFAGRKHPGSHFSNYDTEKKNFSAKLPPMPQWGLHDLRRTARSLMSRAGVLPHISERVLGHSMRGVEGIYDRHEYGAEKAHALESLASLIANIVNPTDKVVRLRG
jgi:integrase